MRLLSRRLMQLHLVGLQDVLQMKRALTEGPASHRSPPRGWKNFHTTSRTATVMEDFPVLLWLYYRYRCLSAAQNAGRKCETKMRGACCQSFWPNFLFCPTY